jgi:hypothetical protein
LLLVAVAVPQKPVTPMETVTAVMARRRLSRAAVHFMQAAAVVHLTLPVAICPVAMAAAVQAAMALAQLQVRLAPLIQAAVVVALMARLLLEQAAPASSSSNTPSPFNLS